MAPTILFAIVLQCMFLSSLAFQLGWSASYPITHHHPSIISSWQPRQQDVSLKPSTPSITIPFYRSRKTALFAAWPWDDENEELVAEKEEALKKAEANALRYENRAASLESALKNRTAELKLMKNRVVILQDVARKIRCKQNNTLIEMEGLRERAMERDEIEATLNATYDELDRQTTRLQRLLDEEKRATKEVAMQYDDLMNELEQKDMEIKKLQSQTGHDRSELERRLKAERRGRQKDREQFELIKGKLESRLESVTDVARDLENELNRTIADVESLRLESKRSRDKDDQDIRATVKEERKKRQFLKQELVAARMAEREAVEALERMEKRLLEQQKKAIAARERERDMERKMEREGERKRNETIASDTSSSIKNAPPPSNDFALKKAEEKVEIATAAVRAAEKREEAAQARVSKVQDELRTVLRDNDRLSLELRDALDQQNAALERLDNFRSSHGRREEALTKRVVRAEQNLRRVEEEMDLLRSERDDVREALLSERLKFASERREEQMRYDRIMRNEREGFEMEISLLNDQLSRQSARSQRQQSQRQQTELNQQRDILPRTESETSSEGRLAVVPVEKATKKKGRFRRVWKRVLSPSSWFAG